MYSHVPCPNWSLYPGLYSCFVSDVGSSSRQQRRASAWPAAAGDGAADSAGEEAIASHQPSQRAPHHQLTLHVRGEATQATPHH